ncbi:MAG: hypothetical protein KGK00_14000 [Paracoccaceae bacterium]|nr:hypothetical protein [Paracoccaceae bacterium]MDE3240791.1 hypothetical protein [Paracoccaceae bacterium]
MVRKFLGLGLVLMLSACLGAKPAPNPLLLSPAESLARSKAQCEATGGRYMGRTGGAMLCFHTPSDAGKSCTRSTECSAGCLAKSRTCAPITPLIGCQQLLDSEGRLVTQCVN